MNDSALTLPQVKADLEAKIDRLDEKIDGVETRLEAKIDGGEARLEAKIDGVRTDLEAKIDGVWTDLEAKIDCVRTDLEAKIDGVRTDLEAKIDGLERRVEERADARTQQILVAIRDTAETLDARQDRRRRAEVVALRHSIDDRLGDQREEWRRELLEHVRDDTRHVKPRARRKSAR
jgi:Skp family chaperone for outer membrane proteins